MRRFISVLGVTLLLLMTFTPPGKGSSTVPADIQLPGTQTGEMTSFTGADNCGNCHGGTVNPALEPHRGWQGSMMAHAARDPLFWATLAIAEQDFLPGSDPATRGGAGDLCLRCHTPNGWLQGRSLPTDGSALSSQDVNGVECEFCHLFTDPDEPLTTVGTVEEQNAPFLAYLPGTGITFRGSGQFVLNGNGTRLGPYSDANAKHAAIRSLFHRQSEMCGTCHDVSNSAVGDLAPNNGAQIPLAPGQYSGVPGGPLTGKAAFKNPPHTYGVVERTFSEWKSSGFPTLLVNNYPTLPAGLRVPGGSLDVAYHRAYDARSNANHEDGALRYYTCQTCHMSAGTGVGCNKAGTPTRTDLGRHDLTGAGHWMPDAVAYLNNANLLRLGNDMTADELAALGEGKTRAIALIQSAASLAAAQNGAALDVTVTNLTGHKLISGYPEGRRMWINIRWYDGSGALVQEDGAWGNIGRTVADRDGTLHNVKSLLDPDSTRVFEVDAGLDQAWAAKLISLGYPAGMVLSWDRMSDTGEHTLGELAASAPGTSFHSFHFVLNNVVRADNRIPPWGFAYDVAAPRNTLPAPTTQFGNPGPGGTFNHWDLSAHTIPAGAARAEVRLYYQQTSWEYIQFLWKQNDGLNTFLGQEAINLLDAWANTGMAAPVQMAMVNVTGLTPPAAAPGEASAPADGDLYAALSGGDILVTYVPACSTTGHRVVWGDLASIGSYAWSGGVCSADVSGAITFTPPSGNIAFVVVGYNATAEGSYGADSALTERPESSGLGVCDQNQNLAASCD